jgi:predicted PurR-regulated permease PerM
MTVPPQTDVKTIGIVILATLATIASLYVGAELLIPIAVAIILTALLRPAMRLLLRMRLSPWLAATLLILGLVAGLMGLVFLLTVPLKKSVAKAPETFAAAQKRVSELIEPVQKLTKAADQIGTAPDGQAAKGSTTGPTTQTQSALPPPPATSDNASTTGHGRLFDFTSLVGTTSQLVGGISEVLLLSFLMLASDDLFLKKLVRLLHSRDDRTKADDIVQESQAVVFRYLAVTALINVGQGAVVGVAMWWLGMPAPMLWAGLTFVFEFIPYLGAAFMIAMLSMTALATTDSLRHALLAPGSYVLITTLQNNLVSPIAYGKRLKLNPVAVLIGVLFWWFIWGIGGAFIAVPLLAITKVIADRTGRFPFVAEFLGE